MNITGDLETATKSLLESGREWCTVTGEQKMEGIGFAWKTVGRLLDERHMEYTNIEILYDNSGAPVVKVLNPSGGEIIPKILISLSDEAGFRVCLAVQSENLKRNELLGVGIDLVDVHDAAGILNISPERFKKCFSPAEWKILSGIRREERNQYVSLLLAGREAAFKSMSCVYDKYRKENHNRPLKVSFMDFYFPGGKKAVPRRLTGNICKREKIEIESGFVSWGSLAGSVAVCRRTCK